MTEYSELVKKLRDLHRDPRPASAVWLFDNQIALYDAAAAIEALQAQLPKRGEWVHGKELSRAYIGNCCVGIVYEDFRCSACGVAIEESEKPKWKYCPNCGADMRKMEVQE